MQPALTDPDYRTFVLHVVELRKSHGVSQGELARRLGRHQSYVSKSERFERRLDPAEFHRFCVAIGADSAAEFAVVASALAGRSGLTGRGQ